MPKKIFDFDVAFSVVGDWDKVEDVPWSVLMAGLEQRLRDLRANPNPEFDAVNCFNISDL
jgi:hypothetical protein